MEDLLTLNSAAVVTVGFASGVLAGMFGVGGAVITTPGVRVLGASPIEAVGSTIPAILPGAVSGAARYAREGLVDWRIGLVCGASGTVLAVAGAWTSDVVDAGWLMVLTAAILGWSGYRILRSGASPAPDHEPLSDPASTSAATPGADTGGDGPSVPTVATTRPSTAVLLAVGAAAGYLAGLLGIGGGVLMMPAFTGLLHLPVKRAVASSLVAVGIFSVPALASHWWLGHIDWRFALLLVVGVVPGARLGAHITVGSSDRTVRVALGIFFIVLAVVYGGRELAGVL